MSGVEFELDLDADDAIDQVVKLGGGLDELLDDLKKLDDMTGAKMFRDTNGRLRDAKGRFVGVGKAGVGAFGGIGESMTGAVFKGMMLTEIVTGIARAAVGAGLAVLRLGAQAVSAFTRGVLAASEFRERMAFGFKTLSKGASDGTAELKKMRDLSLEFGTNFEETTQQMMRLRKMGFAMSDAEELFRSMQDLKTVGATADEIGRALLAITQIKATGTLQGDELMQLSEAGVDLEKIYGQLAKQMGKTVPEIKKLKEAGKIDADSALTAIKAALAETTGAKFAGEKGKEFADNTVTGMVNRLKAMPGVLFDTLAEKVGPEFMALRPILDDVVSALKSEEAAAVVNEIAAGVRAIFRGVVAAWPVVKELVSGFSEGFGDSWKMLKEVASGVMKAFGGENGASMKDFMVTARALGIALGHVVGLMLFMGGIAVTVVTGITSIVAAVTGLIHRFGELTGNIGMKARELGTAIVNGIVNGITGGAESVISSLRNLATRALGAAKSALGVHSPSKEFEWIGQMVGEGFAGGVDFSSPAANDAMTDMVAPPAVPSSNVSNRNTITVNVNVTGSDASPEAIGEAVRRKLESLMESLAIEAGAA